MDRSGTSTGNGSLKKSETASRPRPGGSSSNAPPVIRVEEIPGSFYNSLDEAQSVMLPGLARLIVQAIRTGLETGKLKVGPNNTIVWKEQ